AEDNAAEADRQRQLKEATLLKTLQDLNRRPIGPPRGQEIKVRLEAYAALLDEDCFQAVESKRATPEFRREVAQAYLAMATLISQCEGNKQLAQQIAAYGPASDWLDKGIALLDQDSEGSSHFAMPVGAFLSVVEAARRQGDKDKAQA